MGSGGTAGSDCQLSRSAMTPDHLDGEKQRARTSQVLTVLRHAAAAKITAYGGSDPEMLRLASGLQAEVSEFTRSLGPRELKAKFFGADTVARVRDGFGAAMKRPEA
jgi:hypothetical protein